MLIATHELTPERLAALGPQHRHWTYNGLDCCVTQEVHEIVGGGNSPGLMTPSAHLIYEFERGLQAPALEMMTRGFLVDQTERRLAMRDLESKILHLDGWLQQMATAVWGKPLNPKSHQQVKDFFYGAMRLPEVYSHKKGERKISSDREALESLSVYLYARPIISTLLAVKDCAKLLSTLESEVDPDGRMRTSYNIAGTETGRWSSSASAYATGTNLQNITRRLRRVFVADPGWKLCSVDLEQAESREVGYLCGTLFNEWSYLDACESGDLHTLTAKLIWPDLEWPGDSKGDRALADKVFYRDFTYRDMSKRGGHGSNYLGTPATMARHLKVLKNLMEYFQAKYFQAFPGIPMLHQWIARELQTKKSLITPFGRERLFFGRSTDDATLREAVAFIPQSSTADRTNLGLYRIWRHFGLDVQLLAQTHDSVTFQYRPKDETIIIPKALQLIQTHFTAPNGRQFTIPGEAKVGWNWGDHHNPGKPLGTGNKFNPNGLIKYKGSDGRERLVGLDNAVS